MQIFPVVEIDRFLEPAEQAWREHWKVVPYDEMSWEDSDGYNLLLRVTTHAVSVLETAYHTDRFSEYDKYSPDWSKLDENGF